MSRTHTSESAFPGTPKLSYDGIHLGVVELLASNLDQCNSRTSSEPPRRRLGLPNASGVTPVLDPGNRPVRPVGVAATTLQI